MSFQVVAQQKIIGSPVEMDHRHVTEGMNHSSVTEESLNLKDELDTSVDDRPSYLKKYTIHSRICDIQELIDNRKVKDDLFMELKSKCKSHGKTDERSLDKQAVMKQSSSSFEPPNDKGPMHFIYDSHRGGRRMLTCGICNKLLHTNVYKPHIIWFL